MYRYSVIKSIQRGTLTLSAVQTTNTATILIAVVLANAVLNVTYKVDSGNNQATYARFDLTDTTTITGLRIAAGGSVLVAEWEVTEYYPNIIRSIQPFSITMDGVASNTYTLPVAVVTAKTRLVLHGMTNDQAAIRPDYALSRLILTDTLTVTANRHTATGITIANGVAVEFK